MKQTKRKTAGRSAFGLSSETAGRSDGGALSVQSSQRPGLNESSAGRSEVPGLHTFGASHDRAGVASHSEALTSSRLICCTFSQLVKVGAIYAAIIAAAVLLCFDSVVSSLASLALLCCVCVYCERDKRTGRDCYKVAMRIYDKILS